MPAGDKDRLNRIEELKNRLFSRNSPVKMEHRDELSHLRKLDVPESWVKKESSLSDFPEKFFRKTSVFKKFFLFSIGFFVLAVGYSAYMFFIGGNTVSNSNIDITVVGNTFTAGGEELPLIVGVVNRNSSSLELVDLVVEYPKSSSGDLSGNTERLRDSLGTISPGSTKNDTLKVVLFGEQGSVRPIKISIEYRVEGSNAIFVKEKIYEVTINSTPINLSVEAPEEISPNQDLNLNVKATLNATRTASNVLLRVDYPIGFQFSSARPAPSFGNNVWKLGDLSPGSTSNIAISGKMIDVFDGEEKTFRIWSGSQSPTDKSLIDLVFNSAEQVVTIKRPFIQAQLYVNGSYQSEYALDSKTTIQGQIHWSNNLDTKIDNLKIVAKISGNAVDRKNIKTDQGFYDSSSDSIIWDKNYQDDFAEVNPGDAGVVLFTISPTSLFSGSGGLLSSPSVHVDVSISGKQPQQSDALRELNNSESKTIKIISDVGFADKLLYYSGAFSNTGPIPPKAEKPTTYTVVWTLSNSSNNISKTQIRSSLPPWAEFTGPVSPSGEALTFDPSTKEIVWNVGNIPRGAGILGEGREVTFQVTLTPSLSQVGTRPVVINDAVLTGHDDFANVDVRINKTSLNTGLTNDPGFPANGDRVVE